MRPPASRARPVRAARRLPGPEAASDGHHRIDIIDRHPLGTANSDATVPIPRRPVSQSSRGGRR